MKKTMILLAIAAFGFLTSACVEKIGTEPGNDTKPVVTVYGNTPSSDYNADECLALRLVSNGKVSQAFKQKEKTTDKEAAIASQGEAAYIKKVMTQGQSVSFTEGVFETTLTGLAGDYDVSVVASDGAQQTLRSISFNGIAWDESSSIAGTYTFGLLGSLHAPVRTLLQRSVKDPNLMRFKDLYGDDKNLKFTVMQETGVDSDGKPCTFVRVLNQLTGFVYDGNPIYVRDVAAWQGSDSWATNIRYACYKYDDNRFSFMLQYRTSAGSLGYNNRDTFIPE